MASPWLQKTLKRTINLHKFTHTGLHKEGRFLRSRNVFTLSGVAYHLSK
jgi:hypothetical protein